MNVEVSKVIYVFWFFNVIGILFSFNFREF